ncbi:serine phosphatase RsbU (regulator of sigma subunit) [Kitasatospora sp. SolWspMP-SS2h]|uniref:PP2C family protein-serine/threonine phosphatase n=1 Tax=Kitasatospora sp. SolWspMP-SS2h TaxID=1305729 RepID=UPI000DB92F4C|nr:PP2C family protein-serine/threonine phosphatase [Kitasatospora sp. SolWspMP-SS2h]RAJ41806.1 serine phosphatase RsbU (regulator of sigma subunit) [Kitasatospora sp. SolWspMP-SS2h]
MTGTPRRAVRLLLMAAASLSVLLPLLRGATTAGALAEFGAGRGTAVAAQLGSALALLTALLVAGRAVDARGWPRVLRWALGVMAAGGAVAVTAGHSWTYLAGRAVADAGSAGVLIAALASVPLLNLPGRITRVVGGAVAGVAVVLVLGANVAVRIDTAAGWRLGEAVVPAAAALLLLVALRLLPRDRLPRSTARSGPVGGPGVAAAVLPAVAGLELGPLRGWSDPVVGGLLVAAAALLAAGRVRAVRRARSRPGPAVPGVPARAAAGALVAGATLGFTQLGLTAAVPVLLLQRGVPATHVTLSMSGYGLGMLAAGLTARHWRLTPLTSSSLGLPLAAVGLASLHFLPDGAGQAALVAGAVAVLVGFGLVITQIPYLAGFLAALPRQRRAAASALYPVAILLGGVLAQTVPGSSALLTGTDDPDALSTVLWVACGAVALVAMVLGRPVVSLTVAAAAGLQHLLLVALAGERVADRPGAAVAALAVGAAAGLVAWSRRQQSERLARVRASEIALQQAVLHPIPARLGELRLTGHYQPATAGTGVGGDFFEAVRTPHGTRLLIGDVRGKGLQAVQTVTELLGCFRSQAHETADLGELAARLDRQLARLAAARGDEELFATALLLQHRDGVDQVEVVNCGHLAPLRVGPDGAGAVPVPALLPLGLGALGHGPAPAPTPLALPGGSALLLHTDGLSEARNSSGEFYPLDERLSVLGAADPGRLIAGLVSDVRDWTHQLSDDIALIALTRARAG